MSNRLFGIAVLTIFAATATVVAHEHKVMGTVTMGMSDSVMMKTTDGKDVTVKITPETKITKGKEAVKLDTLKAGTRIVVTTASDEPPYTAIAIQVGEAAKATPQKK
jgi:biopolymer transport protein ExbD